MVTLLLLIEISIWVLAELSTMLMLPLEALEAMRSEKVNNRDVGGAALLPMAGEYVDTVGATVPDKGQQSA